MTRFILAPHLVFILQIVGVGLVDESIAVPAVLIAVYGIGLLYSYVFRRSIYQGTEALLLLLAATASIAYSLLEGEHILHSFRHLLAAVLVLRAFRRMAKRDYIFSFLVSTVLFLYVGRLYSQLPLLPFVFLNLVVVPYALFHFLAHFGGFQKTGPIEKAPGVTLTWQQFKLMSGVSLALAAIVVGLFILIPRPRGTNPFGDALDNLTAMTGLSDNVRLGAFDRLVEQRTIVMAVETEKPALWRARVLDYYDNGVWIEAAGQPWRAPGPLVSETDRVRSVRRFEIFDLKLTSFQLPCAGDIISARGTRNLWRIWMNGIHSTLSVPSTEVYTRGAAYEVVSQDGEFIGSGTIGNRSFRLPPPLTARINETDLFLQLPTDLHPRVQRLAMTLTDGKPTIDEKVDSIKRYLAENYTYSTENLADTGNEPLNRFLFDSRQGHCEYFATAMTILLRCAGVRARCVQGFMPGSSTAGKYIVRLSDAHMWTEVFHPGHGWKTCDPTPGSEARRVASARLTFMEKAALKWHTHVLQYDRGMQLDVARGIRQSLSFVARAAVRIVIATKRFILFLTVILIIAVASRRAFKLLRSMSQPGPTDPYKRLRLNRVRSSFGRYLKELSRKGYTRQPGTTPNDLLAALDKDNAPVISDAQFITQLFYRTRFGKAPPTLLDLESVKSALERIKRWSRAQGGRRPQPKNPAAVTGASRK